MWFSKAVFAESEGKREKKKREEEKKRKKERSLFLSLSLISRCSLRLYARLAALQTQPASSLKRPAHRQRTAAVADGHGKAPQANDRYTALPPPPHPSPRRPPPLPLHSREGRRPTADEDFWWLKAPARGPVDAARRHRFLNTAQANPWRGDDVSESERPLGSEGELDAVDDGASSVRSVVGCAPPFYLFYLSRCSTALPLPWPRVTRRAHTVRGECKQSRSASPPADSLTSLFTGDSDALEQKTLDALRKRCVRLPARPWHRVSSLSLHRPQPPSPRLPPFPPTVKQHCWPFASRRQRGRLRCPRPRGAPRRSPPRSRPTHGEGEPSRRCQRATFCCNGACGVGWNRHKRPSASPLSSATEGRRLPFLIDGRSSAQQLKTGEKARRPANSQSHARRPPWTAVLVRLPRLSLRTRLGAARDTAAARLLAPHGDGPRAPPSTPTYKQRQPPLRLPSAAACRMMSTRPRFLLSQGKALRCTALVGRGCWTHRRRALTHRATRLMQTATNAAARLASLVRCLQRHRCDGTWPPLPYA